MNHVEDALHRMSVSEMVAQLTQIHLTTLLESDPDHENKMRVNQTALEYYIGELGIGSVLNTVDWPLWSAREYRAIRLQIQDCAQRHNRPPVLWGMDSIYQVNFIQNATFIPQPINMAATFNRTVALEAGRLRSRDTRAAGMNWLCTPMLGLSLEPKWSRYYETFGEDPFVSGEIGVSVVQGIQAAAPNDGNTTASSPLPSLAAACAKSFLGNSKPYNGRDRTPSWIPTRHLYQYFVHPWRKVVDAGVLTIMESYTETDGVPLVANGAALNYLLRQQLGFDGVVLTEWGELERLLSWHRIQPSEATASVYAFQQTSVDVSMVPRDALAFIQTLLEGVQNKTLTQDRIRESTRRVLKLKNQLRMWDEVLTMDNTELDLVGTDEAQVLDMVHQSIVLTKNENNVLPFVSSSATRLNVLVTGPTADSLVYQSGSWSYQRTGTTSDGWFTYGSTVAKAFGRESAAWNVTYTCGIDIQGEDCNNSIQTDDGTPSSFDQAVELAHSSDVVIVCVGEAAYGEKGGDIRSLDLPDGQYALVNAIATQTDAKIVLVVFGGRPRFLKAMVDQADAVLVAFLPGPSAGDALVDIVAGRVNPSARLPITYPLFDDVSPYYHAVSDQCESGPCTVQWPFGHGLSFTSFAYHNLTLTPISHGDGTGAKDLDVSVVVTNTGSLPGAEVVLIFTFDEYRATTPEYKRLRAFDKVFLQPGEAHVVQLKIPVDDLRFVGPHDDRHFVLDPSLTFWVGVGALTDCRVPQTMNGETDRLCVYSSIQNLIDPASIHHEDTNDSPHCAACDAACDLWVRRSSCGSEVGLSINACLSMCTAVNAFPAGASDLVREGWGWNYVNCLESVVTGVKHQSPPLSSLINDDQCWKMTLMCRDIFKTENLDEYGIGPHLPMENAHGQAPFSYALALLSAVVSTLLIFHAMYGSLPGDSETGQTPWRRRWTRIPDIDTASNEDPGMTMYQRIEEVDEEEEEDLLGRND